MLKKVIIDFIMLMVMMILMCLNITGSFIHELLGIIILFIIIIHLFLNINVIRNIIVKFKNMPIKNKINYITDLIIAFDIIIIIVTGVLISNSLFTNINVINKPLWSSIHHFFAYLGICLIGIHLGFHLDSIIKYIKVKIKYREHRYKDILYSILSLVLMGNGLYNMIKPAFYNNFKIDFNNDQKDTLEDKKDDEVVSSSSSNDSVSSTKISLADYLKDKYCGGCGRHCSLASPRCNNSQPYIESATSEYYNLYGNKELNNNEDSSLPQTLSTKVTLNDYLAKEHCTGCHNYCPLTNIGCNIGLSAVENATKQYNELYSNNIKETVEIENSNINLFGYLSIISFYALGTHYIIRIINKNKTRK